MHTVSRSLAVSFLLSIPCLICAPRSAYSARSSQPISQGYATYFSVASCQREGNSGITASGVRLKDSALVCALPQRNFGESYRVCRADQPSRCVEVTHLDYGPGKKPRSRGVIVDLSEAAFKRLAPLATGKLAVTVERLE